MIPHCKDCGKPLGLYYADCGTCALYADRYSYMDYLYGGAFDDKQ